MSRPDFDLYYLYLLYMGTEGGDAMAIENHKVMAEVSTS